MIIWRRRASAKNRDPRVLLVHENDKARGGCDFGRLCAVT